MQEEERGSGEASEETPSEVSFEGWGGQVKEEGKANRKWRCQREKRWG